MFAVSTIMRTLRPRYGRVSPLTKRFGAASSISPNAWRRIQSASLRTMARSSLSGVVMGAATYTPPPSVVIWTVFLRRSLRRTS